MDAEVDRVSNLPESLIHHILSFLYMKYVVQTSILSRRWRYVWTTVSTLVFSVNEFASPGTVLHSIQMNKFTRFIDKVLLLRGISDIKRFHLHWVDNLFDTFTVRELLEDHLNAWILVSLSHNVQELLIQIDTAANYHYLEIRFPHCLFNSQSLRKLVLDLTGSRRISQIDRGPTLSSVLQFTAFEIGNVIYKMLLACNDILTQNISFCRISVSCKIRGNNLPRICVCVIFEQPFKDHKYLMISFCYFLDIVGLNRY
ncbi:F-box/LRR-repeat protein At3g59210-like isoform X2 [Papaver somniferum]|uniref:F-box/LRR-repeat protein At3g59210-like isoform X2 n=1 Tax=Papaver somniferum TaxID=3469 RepID=UPI000E703666|nr:F-box/LRR-repeat protein At3g59210-like isoform X2 [Papaver somniferum]